MAAGPTRQAHEHDDEHLPWVAETLTELITGATDRVEVRTSDAKSGARFETLTIEGRRHFLKVLSGADD